MIFFWEEGSFCYFLVCLFVVVFLVQVLFDDNYFFILFLLNTNLKFNNSFFQKRKMPRMHL